MEQLGKNNIKKRISFLITFILTLVVMATAISFAATFVSAETSGSASKPEERLEKLNDNVTITGNKTLPKSSGYSDEELKRVGVLVSSKQNGDTFKIRGDMAGLFEMKYRVFSSTATRREISELYITFKDEESNRSFTLETNSRGGYETVITGAFVDGDPINMFSFNGGATKPDDVDGVTRGVTNSYHTDGLPGGLYHTTTFSNNLSPNATEFSYQMVPTTLMFNPQTMQVLVVTQDNWWQIIDLDDPVHMAKAPKGVMKGFEKYSVTVAMTLFSPMTDGLDGKMLIYSLNGQELIPAAAGKGFKNTAGPTIGAKASSKALVGKPYTINKPLAYDVKDGFTDYTANAVVKNSVGSIVPLSGESKNIFTPTAPGKYTVYFPLNGAIDKNDRRGNDNDYYNAKFRPFTKDASGNWVAGENNKDNPKFLPYGKANEDGGITYVIDAVATHPGSPVITISNALDDHSYLPVKGKLTLPIAEASNPMGVTSYDKLPVAINITKTGGETVEVTKNANSEIEYTFEDEGFYTVSYIATDVANVSARREFVVEVSKDVPVFTIPTFERLISKNATFSVPTITAKTAENVFKVETKIIAPDGSKVDIKSGSFVCRDVGRYEMISTATFDNKTYVNIEYFSVKTTPDSLFENIKGSVIEKNVDAPDYAGDWSNRPYNGVQITASGNAPAVKFVNPVNVSDNNKEQSLLEYMVTPTLAKDNNGNYIYTAEMSVIDIRLTDIYDPDNYLTINLRACGSRGFEYATMVKASAGDSIPAGLGWDNATLITSSWGGTSMPSSFCGMPIDAVSTVKSHAARIYLNYATKELFVEHPMGSSGIGEEGQQLLRVTDLDDPKIVGVGNEWRGFTTGEVYVTFTANELSASKAKYIILDIDGVSMAGDTISSGKLPLFQVDYKGQSSPPDGEVNVPYPIFKTKVVDVVDGELPIRARVFYKYGEANQEEITEITNGAFTPKKEGRYTFVYSSGAQTHTEEVNVVSKIDDLDYEFSVEPSKKGIVGRQVVVPSGKILGGSGDNKTLVVKAGMFNAKNEFVECPIENGAFVPPTQGIYKVSIYIRDYLGREYNSSYDVKVIFNTKPVITNLPSVPKVIQLNKPFLFPEMIATDYYSNKAKPTKVVASIAIDGVTLSADRIYTPVKEGKITVVYKAAAVFNSNNFVEQSYTIDVVDYSKANKGDYFYKTGTFNDNVVNERYAGISTKDKTASMQFANALIVDGFNFKFIIPSEYSKYNKLNITLTDSVDAYQKVTINVVKEDDAAYLYIAGVKGGALNGAFGNNDKEFSLYYNVGTKKIQNFSRTNVGTILTTDYNEKFIGFPSGKIYLDVSFSGLTDGDAGLFVRSINGQLFDDSIGDYVNPKIMLNSRVSQTAQIGELVAIPYAIAGDVLDSVCSLKVAVLAPDGTYALEPSDMAQGMSFKATKYGNYTILYTAKDTSENKKPIRYSVFVADKVPPVITIDGEVPKTALANWKIKLPAATVTDNFSKDIKINVFVLDASNRMIVVNDFTFKPTEKGVYTIYYYAEDESSSYSYLTYEIIVK